MSARRNHLVESLSYERVAEIVILRVREWDRFTWLRHGFSTRSGGVSKVYGGNSLNLGWTKEDDPASVAENRRRFVSAAAGEMSGKPGFALVTVRQVHSAVVHGVREPHGALDGKLQTAEGKAVLEGDGLITTIPGVMLGVGTADCVPVLVVDVKNRVVGAFHAGWRGTVARIVEQGVHSMRSEYGSHPDDLVAAIGPSIGLCCYAVGQEVRAEFHSQFSYADDLFRKVGSASDTQLYVDLWEANRLQLLDAGLGQERITVMAECTACARDTQGRPRYFSHRAEHGVAGRMLSVVGVTPGG
jgi:YfiH family protein